MAPLPRLSRDCLTFSGWLTGGPWRWDGTNFSLAAQINPGYGTELWKFDGTNAVRVTDFSGYGGYYAFMRLP